MGRKRETDIAKPALAMLESMGFDCYQEVPFGGRADIVGVLAGRTICVCEVKAALTFEVIAQAKRWAVAAQWCFVAIPEQAKSTTSAGRALAFDVCVAEGIGVIEIGADSSGWNRARIRTYPSLKRSANPARLLAALRPEHKTFAAAGSNGRFWSPWRESVERMQRMAQRRPGIPLSELVATLHHHWSSSASAKSCISRQIHAGIIRGLFLRKESGEVRVYPEAARLAASPDKDGVG